MNKTIAQISVTGRFFPVLVLLSILALSPGFSAPAAPGFDNYPPVSLRPELYLGWNQPEKRPEIKRLPWQLKISIRGVNPDNKRTIVGPLTINTREEFAGITFGRGALTPTPPTDSAGPTDIKPASIELESLDFATQATHQGANLINLRCYVKLRSIQDARVSTYSTTSTLECRPGRETTLAEFPALKLLLTADWEGPVLIE